MSESLPTVRFGRTNLHLPRIALGGFPFGVKNTARGWDPFTDEGRRAACALIHTAIDAGIVYIDTAAAYGKGHSESIIGEATRDRRDEVVLATKVPCFSPITPQHVHDSIDASRRRLGTDVIDVIQLHGIGYRDEQIRNVLEEGVVDALEAARDAGRVRFIGFTVEEPWSGRAFVASGRFDMVQVRYNLIYQAAAHHLLDEAKEQDMGVAVMRPMTSGMLPYIAARLAPKWQDAHDLYQTSLKFVLSDSRVHVSNVGMRWPEEVAMNVELLRSFRPPFDVATMPRWTAEIYQAEDA